jgi:hypothetical protein
MKRNDSPGQFFFYADPARVKTARDLHMAAKEIIRRRLIDRTGKIDDIFLKAGIPEEMKRPVTKLVLELERVLGIPVRNLKPDEPLANELTVLREAFAPGVRPLLDKEGLTGVDPFAYEFLEAFDNVIDQGKWRAAWEELGKPKGDDRILDALMNMNFMQFLRFTSSICKASPD